MLLLCCYICRTSVAIGHSNKFPFCLIVDVDCIASSYRNLTGVPSCKIHIDFSYFIWCYFVYAAFVVVLRCVVGFGFGQLLQCVCTFKCYLYVSLFEEVVIFLTLEM